MPDLWDDGRIEVILSLGLAILIKGAYDIDDREHSAIGPVTLFGRIIVYPLELCLRFFSLQFLDDLLAIVTVCIRVRSQRVIDHYFC